VSGVTGGGEMIRSGHESDGARQKAITPNKRSLKFSARSGSVFYHCQMQSKILDDVLTLLSATAVQSKSHCAHYSFKMHCIGN
jgi:hypothetical protein